ncbi:hypothetical protein PHYSODRAFT_264686 [Phytophthora sojae]|uniref:Uncharacterized protein n=1 Tax=Phytophthora sojae (strain P6497) TaxID=1094619 RepID=G4ZZ50_PHYSP|nr:hypothetical protein PHYSODRAFT_264686 [Phytophthora sojae]EGZ11072.1 hypothetical protein PHYSODRAFT_264686 [Phytophthora sojae]|eukprot:XP_009533817.1 hypothetical protein PHYSODRAFT_264686 [Phytophthora sojae]
MKLSATRTIRPRQRTASVSTAGSACMPLRPTSDGSASGTQSAGCLAGSSVVLSGEEAGVMSEFGSVDDGESASSSFPSVPGGEIGDGGAEQVGVGVRLSRASEQSKSAREALAGFAWLA